VAKIRVNISVDKDINLRWTKVAEKMRCSKSSLVEDLLKEALPYLEGMKPNNVIPKSIETLGKKLQELGNLIKECEEKKEK